MNDAITSVAKSAKEAESLRLGLDFWTPLLIAFMLGSFTSAFWTLRSGKKAKWNEATSTILCAGMMSVLFWSLMSDYGMPRGLHIGVSIACGFTGDTLVRIVAQVLVKVVKSFINPEIFKS